MTVTNALVAVQKSTLPTLNADPPDWAEYQAAYVDAKSASLTWADTVLARLLTVPADVQTYNAAISQVLVDAVAQATTLRADPSDAAAAAELDADLTDLASHLSLVSTFIAGAVTAVQGFQNTLPQLTADLQTIATKSAADAQVDQHKIDALNAAVKQLQDDISAMTAEIIALGIADGVAITLGTVISIAAWPFGAVAWLMLGPVVAVATAFIHLDAIRIKADKALIESNQNQISGDTADCAALQVLTLSFAQLSTQTAALAGNLQAILTEWQNLESDVSDAITEVRTATTDKASANYQAVIDDLNDAVSEWNAAYAQSGNLFLTLQGTSAPLQVGMTSDEVQTAISAGTTIDIIDYWNAGVSQEDAGSSSPHLAHA